MKLKWIKKVYSDGKHNAFTGLAFFKGRYFLAFRHAVRHSFPAGCQIVMTSPDGENWKLQRETAFPSPTTVPANTPIDSRDSYFLNLGHELRLYSFAIAPLLPSDEWMIPPYSTVQSTIDGEIWTEPRAVMEDVILWKPIYWQNRFWCAGYRRIPERGHGIELYQSADGLDWTRGGFIAGGSECFLLPVGEDSLWAFVRAEKAPYHMEIWESSAPFTVWNKIAVIPKIIQAPHVDIFNDVCYLFGRETSTYGKMPGPKKPWLCRTRIWRLKGTEAEEVLELPSLGDTSYVGTMLRPDGLLLVSYYSQHEQEVGAPLETRGGNDKPADVFVAGIEC